MKFVVSSIYWCLFYWLFLLAAVALLYSIFMFVTRLFLKFCFLFPDIVIYVSNIVIYLLQQNDGLIQSKTFILQNGRDEGMANI